VTTDSAVLAGVISGAKYNDLLKSGDGTLEITGNCTYAGGTWVQNGTLLVTGSITGIATKILTGATLAGAGSASHIVLESGGKVSPGKGGLGTLSAAGATWNGGGVMVYDLSTGAATSDRLALGAGGLRKGAAGAHAFDFAGSGANGFTYTLATFGSTEFLAADFSATNLAAGVTGFFKINAGNTLVFITGTPPLPPLETWRKSYFGPSATDAGIAANTADPDFDGRSNLYEYALGSNPLVPNMNGMPFGGRSGSFMTINFSRNSAATDITLRIETSSNLQAASWTNLATWIDATGWTTVPGTTLTETAGNVVFRDLGDLTDPLLKRRFLRMTVTAP
jgi:autotransporter-associated beta strand protein